MTDMVIELLPIPYLDPGGTYCTSPGGHVRIVPTDTMNDDGARLYTDIFGNPIVYIKEVAAWVMDAAEGGAT